MAQGRPEASGKRAEQSSNLPPASISAFAARKTAKNPFADITNRDRGISDRGPSKNFVANDSDATSPPLKRQRIDHDKRIAQRRLSPERGLKPQMIASSEKVPDVHQANHGTVILRTASINKPNHQVPNQPQSHIDKTERSRDSEEENYDTDYGTDIEDDASEIDAESAPTQAPVYQLSTFTPNPKNVISETNAEWTIRLERHDVICLIGQYDIWVRKGAISILGAILHQSSRLHRVYAPSTHSLPCIRPVPNPYGAADQATEITIITCSSGIRDLRELSPKFGRIWNAKPTNGLSILGSVDRSCRSYLLLKSSAEDRHRRPLRLILPIGDRQVLISQLLTVGSSTPGSILVCGPKNSGKSEFCRRLVNAALSMPRPNASASGIASTNCVALLDLDPGQAEYSPPGEISLILLRSCNMGPPFTHPMVSRGNGDEIIRAHHLGSTSPKEDPRHYVKCVLDLLSHYKALLCRYPTCRLVVNSAGWVVDIGLEVLLDIVKSPLISDVVYTSTGGPSDAVDLIRQAAESHGAQMHFVASEGSPFSTRTAKDLRMMQTMSYFHLDEPEAGFARWDARPLTERVPLTIHWAGDKQAIFAVMDLADGVDSEDLLALLDGRIVGIVVVEDDTALPGTREARMTAYSTESIEPPRSRNNTEIAEADLFTDARNNISEDSDSDHESVATSHSSIQLNIGRKDKSTTSGEEPPLSSIHLEHPSVARTSTDVPYLRTDNGSCRPLDPSKSYSLGQALIREPNVETKSLELLTPIPSEVFQTLHRQKRKIILVHGKLETPTWAYCEDWERGGALRRQLRKEYPADAAVYEETALQEWVDATPYMYLPKTHNVRSASGEVWQSHRQVDIDDSDEGYTE